MKALRPLKQLRDDYGVGILVVHHTNRQSRGSNPGKRIRGSSAIWGVADGAMVVSISKDNVLITPQLREGGAAAEFRFAVQTEGGMIKLKVLSAGATATSSDEKYRQLEQVICDFIRQHGRCDMKELESGLKMDQRWLRERLRALEKAGRIKVEVEKVVRTRKYVYSIAD